MINIINIIIIMIILTLSYSSCNALRHDRNNNNNNNNNFVNNKINPYEILELSPPFYQFWSYEIPSSSHVKDAFHRLSLIHHPDKKKEQIDNIKNDKYYIIRDAYDYLKGELN